MRIRIAALIAVVALAVLAPPPHSPTAPVAPPYSPPAPGHWLGTDHLGRDVASRVLDGAGTVLLTATAATIVATLLGVAVGLAAALAKSRGRAPEGLYLRPLDAFAALPPIVALVLVLTAMPGTAGVVIAAAVAGAPLTARVIYAAARPLVSAGHVEAAVARGEGLAWLAGRELLPLLAPIVAADAGQRFVLSVYLVTAAGFLGVGLGGTDWGTLIVEAVPGAALQPVALAAPLLLVAALAVGANLWADAALRKSRTVVG